MRLLRKPLFLLCLLSLGAPAEYGNLMGAVYNIVTKQGTNQFHGDASYFFQGNGLTSNNTKDIKWPNDKFADACADNPTARCPWTRNDYYEATAQLGGPILRDRLWFFNGNRYWGTYSAVAGNYYNATPNSFSLSL